MRYCGEPYSRELQSSSIESTNEHMRVFVASTSRKRRMELIRLSSMYATLHVSMICMCSEKELSKIIPRFLSDLLSLIGMQFIYKDKGKAY